MLTRRYRFGPVEAAFCTDHPAVDAAVGQIMDYLGVPLGVPSSTRHVTLALRVSSAQMGVPPEAGEPVEVDGTMRVWKAGRRLILSDGCFSAELDDEGVRGQIHPDLLDEPDALSWRLLRYVGPSLFLALRRHALFPLHAAALQQGPDGVLLVADSDCGKSTLAFNLVRQGWRYLSDDAIFLNAAGPEVEALPFRRVFGLDVAAQRHFPELAGGDWARQVAEEEKWSVAVDRLFPGQSSEGCTPRVLVFPRIVDASESRLVEIGRAAALHEVARQSALLTVDPDVTPRHLDVLQRLVRQTVHYRLLSGRDLIEDPRRATELLAPLLPAPAEAA